MSEHCQKDRCDQTMKCLCECPACSVAARLQLVDYVENAFFEQVKKQRPKMEEALDQASKENKAKGVFK